MWLHIHFQKANSINDIILVNRIHKKIPVTSRMNEQVSNATETTLNT